MWLWYLVCMVTEDATARMMLLLLLLLLLYAVVADAAAATASSAATSAVVAAAAAPRSCSCRFYSHFFHTSSRAIDIAGSDGPVTPMS